MAGKDVLGFLGIDVDATRDDHVRLTVGEVEVTLLVQVTDVAQCPPTVLVGHRCRLLRIVVVLEGAAAAEVDDTGSSRRKFLAVLTDNVTLGHGAAHRAGMGQPFLGCDLGGPDVLGARVVLVDDRTPPVEHLTLYRDRARGGSMDHILEARQVEAFSLLFGKAQHSDKHRRHELRLRHSIALDELETLARIETLHHDDRSA